MQVQGSGEQKLFVYEAQVKGVTWWKKKAEVIDTLGAQALQSGLVGYAHDVNGESFFYDCKEMRKFLKSSCEVDWATVNSISTHDLNRMVSQMLRAKRRPFGENIVDLQAVVNVELKRINDTRPASSDRMLFNSDPCGEGAKIYHGVAEVLKGIWNWVTAPFKGQKYVVGVTKNFDGTPLFYSCLSMKGLLDRLNVPKKDVDRLSLSQMDVVVTKMCVADYGGGLTHEELTQRASEIVKEAIGEGEVREGKGEVRESTTVTEQPVRPHWKTLSLPPEHPPQPPDKGVKERPRAKSLPQATTGVPPVTGKGVKGRPHSWSPSRVPVEEKEKIVPTQDNIELLTTTDIPPKMLVQGDTLFVNYETANSMVQQLNVIVFGGENMQDYITLSCENDILTLKNEKTGFSYPTRVTDDGLFSIDRQLMITEYTRLLKDANEGDLHALSERMNQGLVRLLRIRESIEELEEVVEPTKSAEFEEPEVREVRERTLETLEKFKGLERIFPAILDMCGEIYDWACTHFEEKQAEPIMTIPFESIPNLDPVEPSLDQSLGQSLDQLWVAEEGRYPSEVIDAFSVKHDTTNKVLLFALKVGDTEACTTLLTCENLSDLEEEVLATRVGFDPENSTDPILYSINPFMLYKALEEINTEYGKKLSTLIQEAKSIKGALGAPIELSHSKMEEWRAEIRAARLQHEIANRDKPPQVLQGDEHLPPDEKSDIRGISTLDRAVESIPPNAGAQKWEGTWKSDVIDILERHREDANKITPTELRTLFLYMDKYTTRCRTPKPGSNTTHGQIQDFVRRLSQERRDTLLQMAEKSRGSNPNKWHRHYHPTYRFFATIAEL